MIPPDTEIEKVMQQTGMGRMQAINHLRGRAVLRQRADQSRCAPPAKHMPATNRHRIRVAVAIFAFYALLAAGMCLQARWDRQCNAAEPGTRWDSELWMCRGDR